MSEKIPLPAFSQKSIVVYISDIFLVSSIAIQKFSDFVQLKSYLPTCAHTSRVTPLPTVPEKAPTVKHCSSLFGFLYSLSLPSNTFAKLDLPEPVGPSTINL